MKRLTTVGLLAILAVTPILLPGDKAPRTASTPSVERVVKAINRQRSLRGFTSLRTPTSLMASSQRWSNRLARTGEFVHASLALTGRLTWLGETLYRGPGGPVRPWLNSPPHRRIMLNPKARLVGIGRSGNVWVGRWGAR